MPSPRCGGGRVHRDPRFGTDVLTSATLDFGGRQAAVRVLDPLEPDQRVHLVGTQGRLVVEIPFNIPPDRPTRSVLTAGGHPPVDPHTEVVEIAAADQYGSRERCSRTRDPSETPTCRSHRRTPSRTCASSTRSGSDRTDRPDYRARLCRGLSWSVSARSRRQPMSQTYEINIRDDSPEVAAATHPGQRRLREPGRLGPGERAHLVGRLDLRRSHRGGREPGRLRRARHRRRVGVRRRGTPTGSSAPSTTCARTAGRSSSTTSQGTASRAQGLQAPVPRVDVRPERTADRVAERQGGRVLRPCRASRSTASRWTATRDSCS